MPTQNKYGNIVTTKRDHDWHATIEGTGIWECGATEDAAIGKLIKTVTFAHPALQNGYYPSPENK